MTKEQAMEYLGLKDGDALVRKYMVAYLEWRKDFLRTHSSLPATMLVKVEREIEALETLIEKGCTT